MKIFPGIHLLFGFTGLAIFILSEISRHSTYDFNMHDTYLVVPSWHVSLIVFFLFSFFGFVYYGFAKLYRPLGKKLSRVHYCITTLTVLLFFILPYFMNGLPGRISSRDSWTDSMEVLNVFITVSFLLFVSAQLLFLINIGMTIFRKKT
jgi:cytochrome c oxidase subunit 1